MFTCFWKMWDWLDPRAMENKKCFIDNEGILGDPPVIGNSSDSGPLMKPQMHNTASQNLKLVQHGAKSARSFCSQSVVHQHSPAVWGGIIPMQHSASVHYHQHGQYPNSRHWQGHIPPGHDSAPSGFDKHFVKPFEPVRNNKMKNSASNNGVAQFQLGTPKKLSQDIIMQGWLHKQGSEGLKVWRKRWFVLSDYCLYYYKGPDEDKVLGSILLPSYKVSLCGSDDKVYRKFAFKCEHANMRTYYLAADSHEVMMNWIRALNMACMLQSNTETVSQYGSNMLPVRNLPVHLQMCNNEPPAAPGQVVQNADMTNASMGSNPSNNSGNGIQPVYANAPPKPRRLTDGSGYSSPSPEYSIYHNNQHMYPYNEHGCSKSPVNMYSRNCDNTLSSCTPPSHNPGRVYYNTVHDYHMQTIPQPDNSGSLTVAGPTIISNVERRTPDTYGRSKLNVNKIKVASDYEDVYSDEVMYKRPLSPVAYSNIKKVSPVASINVQHRPYTPVYISGATLPVDHMRKPVTPQLNTVPRPHSADFLEYEVKHRNNANKVNVANSQQPRPKSSLDITQTPGDNYYYSKESYAESMRKSALYLQQLPVHYHSKSGEHLVMLNGPKMYQRPKKDKHLTTNDGVLSEETSIDMNVCSSPYSKSPVCLRGPEESDYLMDPGNKHVSYCSGSNFFMNDRDIMEHECDVPPQNYEDQFKRSSSARLLRSDHPVHLMHPVHPVHQVYPVHVAHEEVYNTVPVHRDGEQKREESMKRLLEWKQRMLQSPLNRKISSRSVNVGVPRTVTSRPEYLMPPHCKQTKSDSYNVHDSRSLPTFVDSGCSLSQYNSYSSDDEENNLNRSKKEKVVRNKHLQAGRIKEGHPDKVALTYSPTLNASTNISAVARSSLSTSDTTVTVSVASSLMPNSDRISVDELIPQTQTHTPLHTSQIYDDLSTSNCETSASIAEDSYMTMTPKKRLLVSSKHSRQSSSEYEENAYMEMTKGLGISVLNDENDAGNELQHNGDIQPYEVVCFADTDSKIEPVYMELTQPSSNSQSLMATFIEDKLSNEKSDLPDILVQSKNKSKRENTTKSDSSDADDEASKDLDSLDRPCQPRFSLSDTFRPASYYLGAGRVLTEFHDSSDSELVSPPPIPVSPLPMDDLDQSYFRHDYSYNKDHKMAIPTHLEGIVDVLKPERERDTQQETDKEQDSLSAYSINTDGTNKRYSSRSSHNSDSDVELRAACKDSDYERMLKRRPVSLGKHFDESIDTIVLDSCLNNLKAGNSNSLNAKGGKNVNAKQWNHYPPTSMRPGCEYENVYVTERGDDTLLARHSRQSSSTVNDTVNHSLDSIESQSGLSCTYSDSPRSTPLFYGSSVLNQPSTPPYYYSDLSCTPGGSSKKSTIRNTNGRSCFIVPTADITQTVTSSTTTTTTTTTTTFCTVTAINTITTTTITTTTPIVTATNTTTDSTISVTFDALKFDKEKDGIPIDFFANKLDHIDCDDQYKQKIWQSKTIHSSSTLNSKMADVGGSVFPESKLYPVNESGQAGMMKRSHSLEGLLQNVLSDSNASRFPCSESSCNDNVVLDACIEGSHLWEEDSLWRETLRNASQRHTRSLDDLDNIISGSKGEVERKEEGAVSDRKTKLHRGAAYVNESILNRCKEVNVNTVNASEIEYSDNVSINTSVSASGNTSANTSVHDQESTDSTKNEVWNITINMESNRMRPKTAFVIDRETLRQWDLLSSAPTIASTSDNQPQVSSKTTPTTPVTLATPAATFTIPARSAPAVDTEQGSSKELNLQACEHTELDAQHPASGSICVMTPTHDTFPRAMSKRMWSPAGLTPSRSVTLHPRDSSSDYARCPSNAHMYLHPVHQQSPVPHVGHHCSGVPKAAWQWNGRINMSAGELLGRTHEELVLLLIQLRRQSTSTCHAIESCYTEISHIQSQMNNMDAAKRMENLQKLEQLKQHLLELEKQYEKGKPLVNLVDNMVKLGSLYRNPNDQNDGLHVRDRLEFNQQIQEQRLLAEERRNWNRLSPNHMQLQTKVQQLYQLDRLLQEESDTLQGLQHDKEKIEKALGGLRLQLNKGYKNPIEIEHARKEQIRLENELSRVHYMLAQNSKKLEETVAGNARLEQELLVLRQKLQLSRQQRSSVQFSNTGGSVGDSLPCAAGTSAMLENELHRVQQLVGDLQRQRHELSAQVRQLTDRSHTLSQQIRPSFTPLHLSSMNNKKRITTFWRETDLDTMVSVDHGLDSDLENKSFGTMPLYANAETTKAESNSGFHKAAEGEYHYPEEKQLQNFDKPEIKTVRIVKRESERRQRDREKINNTVTPDNSSSPQKWDSVLEEEDLPVNVSSLERVEGSINDTQFDAQVFKHMPLFSDSNNFLNRQASVSSPSLSSQMDAYMNDTHSCSSNHTTVDKSPALSPVFKSEAARQIIIEMSGVSSEPSTLKNSARRMIPKEKRRHYTAPHNNLIMKSLGTLPTDSSYNGTNAVNRRARDDLDMERALRQRTDTPDVVRSTMSTKELKYNENTIDNILGTPNKINIPERYIPEQLPQLSLEEQQHRLRKVESIKKMLSDTAILSSVQSTSLPSGNAETDTTGSNNNNANPKENTVCDVSTMAKATSKMVEEKRQREHLLQLNQILAQQVMEMSKIVAVKALASLPVEHQTVSVDEDDLSPVTPLPLYQQRDNYFT